MRGSDRMQGMHALYIHFTDAPLSDYALYFSEVWWAGRKFGRPDAVRVDREGSLVLQGCLAEAWLVKGSSRQPAGL